jgi:hypothetical protein
MPLSLLSTPARRPAWPRRSRFIHGAAVVALALPAGLRAQAPDGDEAPQRTHVVREGDTLWDLSRGYLGDPFLWPEIYRINTEVVENPHWIYPGESLRIPAGFGPVADATAVHPAGNLTVFAASRAVEEPAATDERPRVAGVGQEPRRVVRAGEYLAAPYVERDGGPTRAGRILQSADLPGLGHATLRPRFQFNDRLFVTPPSGTATAGDRYLAVALGPKLEGVGQVVIPTGIVVVEQAGQGTAARARLVEVFDAVSLGDQLVPLDTTPRSTTTRPEPVQGGATARVVWLKGSPVLPSVQQYLIVNAPASQGLRTGDQLTLYRERAPGAGGVTLPEIEIATAQVLRVSQSAVTAVIVKQSQPAIRTGTAVRVTAKMP